MTCPSRISIIVHRHAVDRYISRCGADPARARYDLIRLANRATPTKERTPAGDAYWLCEACADDHSSPPPSAPVLIVKRDGHLWHVVSALDREEFESQRAGSSPDARARTEAIRLGIDLDSLLPVADAWGFKADTPTHDRLASLKARTLRLARTNEELNLRIGELTSENHRLLNRVRQLEYQLPFPDSEREPADPAELAAEKNSHPSPPTLLDSPSR